MDGLDDGLLARPYTFAPHMGAKQSLDITYVGIVGLTCNGIGPSRPYETMEVCSVYTIKG